jgi:hypothetical protein
MKKKTIKALFSIIGMNTMRVMTNEKSLYFSKIEQIEKKMLLV